MKSTSSKSGALDAVTVLGRWVLGALFLYMGLTKAMHPVEFLKLVRQYDLVSAPELLNAIAAGLPWFEVFCGLLLLAGLWVRGSALMLIGMLVPFSFVVLQRAMAIAAARGMPLCAVKFDCGCGTGEVFICAKLVENGGLLLLSCWLLAGYGRQCSLRYSLARPLSAE
jgi:uncharacterized membrane protein YphA (DoxX/SURF4 family)